MSGQSWTGSGGKEGFSATRSAAAKWQVATEQGLLPAGDGLSDGSFSSFPVFPFSPLPVLPLVLAWTSRFSYWCNFFLREKIGFGTPPPLLADVSGWRSMGFFAACQTVLQAFAWTAVTWGWQSGKDRLAQTSILCLRLWCIIKARCSHLAGFSSAYVPETTQMAPTCNLLLAVSVNQLPKWYP